MFAEFLLSATLIANLAARVQPPAPPVLSQPAAPPPSSRITAQRHYPSDVLVGSTMGYLIGRYVYRAQHLKTTLPSHRLPSVSIQVNRHTQAYAMALRWVY